MLKKKPNPPFAIAMKNGNAASVLARGKMHGNGRRRDTPCLR